VSEYNTLGLTGGAAGGNHNCIAWFDRLTMYARVFIAVINNCGLDGLENSCTLGGW
jgi:hypothetical protein